MRSVRISRIVLSAGAVDKELEKAKRLLEMITDKKAQINKSGPSMRIPAFGVKPKMELGTSVTLRGEDAINVLRRLLGAIDNQLNTQQIDKNNFSFGIAEYINIPGMKYVRDIGVRGFNVTVVFDDATLQDIYMSISRYGLLKQRKIIVENSSERLI